MKTVSSQEEMCYGNLQVLTRSEQQKIMDSKNE